MLLQILNQLFSNTSYNLKGCDDGKQYTFYCIKNRITFSVYSQSAQHIRKYCISELYMMLTHEECSNETYLGIALDETSQTVKKYFPRALRYGSQ
jgi:hypothetical protein